MRQAERGNVQLIPLDCIHILNPRSRDRKQHAEIVGNIRDVGLRRPITVSRAKAGSSSPYNLVCGQGRLEAYRQLKQTAIPAFVRDVPEEECLLMSLVENIARRWRNACETLTEIGQLAERGHDDAEIARLVGTSESWVRDIVGLIRNGEERLLGAVEAGLIPVSTAADIAKAGSQDLQRVLTEVYSQSQLRGRKLKALRRLLDVRAKGQKAIFRQPHGGRTVKSRQLRPVALRRLVEQQAARHRIIVKNAQLAHTSLVYVVEAFRDLLAQEEFTALLEAEGCASVPRPLAERLRGARV
jgi:ParB family chromosome partitioning protein